MVNEPGQVATPARILHALLLICAGALLVIVVTIFSAISDAHSIQVSQDFERFCGMSMRQYNALPASLQHRVNAQCVAEPMTYR